MAHRRALIRRRNWVPWLLAAIGLALDGATVVGFAGYRMPLGLEIPEALLLVAPFLVYGGLAFVVYGARPPAPMLSAMAVLLGLHAGLVAAHTVLFVMGWSLPVAVALRLAHRWSPLIPLLQLVWVPLLALPLAWPAPSPASSFSRRSAATPTRRDIVARGAPTFSRERVRLDRDPGADPGGRASWSPAAAAAPPEAVSVSMPIPVAPVADVPESPVEIPAPIVGRVSAAFPAVDAPEARPAERVTVPVAPIDDLEDEMVAGAGHAPTDAASIDNVVVLVPPETAPTSPAAVTAPSVDVAASSQAEDAVPLDPPRLPATVAALDPEPAPTGEIVEAETRPPAAAVPIMALPAASRPAALPPAPPAAPVEPPLDLVAVARVFEPYGSLLSREGAVQVDWKPTPHGSVVCAAPRDVMSAPAIDLAERLAAAMSGQAAPESLSAVRRVSIRAPGRVVVLTRLAGGVLAAVATRPGALALLEVLSGRAVAGMPETDTDAPARHPGRGVYEPAVSDTVRVETPAASLDVDAPAGVDAAACGELAGRVLATVFDDGGDHALRVVVDVGGRRLTVHPVHAEARPPRYVVVVGGAEPPGLLGRRAERAARALRAAS